MTTLACTARLLSPVKVLITGPEALREWREEQRLPVPGAEYTPRFQRGQWDGTYVPGAWCRQQGNHWELQCSRGLVGRLQKSLPVTLSDNGQPPFLPWPAETHDSLASLRDYQRVAFSAALEHQWGRIALATNAGKGAVIALLAEFATHHNIPVLILCDEISVFDALVDEIGQWTGLEPGLVSSGARTPPSDLVVLAMVPTLAKRLKAYDSPWRKWVAARGMVLLDEADKATAATWRRVLLNAKGSHWRLGFSGTFPNPAEQPYADLQLDELLGPVLVRAKNLELIQRKVSATPQVALHNFDATPALLAIPYTAGWWRTMRGPDRRLWVYEQSIVYNHARHQFITSLISPDTPTAIVVNRIAHGEELVKVLPDAVFLDGSVESNERRAVLERFQQGLIKILIVTKILDRGTNRLGHTTDLLFVSGEGSTRQTLQRIGRGLRRTDGKEFLRLVDIIDYVEVGNGRNRYLKKAASLLHTAARKRIRLYQTEGFEVEIK